MGFEQFRSLIGLKETEKEKRKRGVTDKGYEALSMVAKTLEQEQENVRFIEQRFRAILNQLQLHQLCPPNAQVTTEQTIDSNSIKRPQCSLIGTEGHQTYRITLAQIPSNSPINGERIAVKFGSLLGPLEFKQADQVVRFYRLINGAETNWEDEISQFIAKNIFQQGLDENNYPTCFRLQTLSYTVR
ncbi:MAG: hypothetical protein ABI425_02660 [Patescibacteria group bacterium]